jgi:hypothetical protein
LNHMCRFHRLMIALSYMCKVVRRDNEEDCVMTKVLFKE